MLRFLVIPLLALGAIGGFASGFHHLHHDGAGCHRWSAAAAPAAAPQTTVNPPVAPPGTTVTTTITTTTAPATGQ
jgi:hypothetical protein